MKRYWEALRHPERDRWFRWLWTPTVLAALGWNIWIGVNNALKGEGWWVASAIGAVTMTLIWFWVATGWIKDDDVIRDRRNQPPTGVFSTVRSEDGNDEMTLISGDSVPITRPEDAIDPYHYGMMRAFMDGKPFSAYIDDDGIWRDAETDKPLPVQEKGADDDAPR